LAFRAVIVLAARFTFRANRLATELCKFAPELASVNEPNERNAEAGKKEPPHPKAAGHVLLSGYSCPKINQPASSNEGWGED
jgi:hypothetical protein